MMPQRFFSEGRYCAALWAWETAPRVVDYKAHTMPERLDRCLTVTVKFSDGSTDTFEVHVRDTASYWGTDKALREEVMDRYPPPEWPRGLTLASDSRRAA